jgi:hypothetical protein
MNVTLKNGLEKELRKCNPFSPQMELKGSGVRDK